MRKNQPSLFDLLLDVTCPWEAIETEQQFLAIDVLARMIANAVPPHSEEKDNE